MKSFLVYILFASTLLIAEEGPKYNIGDYVFVQVNDEVFLDACNFPEMTKIVELRYNTESTIYEIEPVQCRLNNSTIMMTFSVFEENLTLVKKGNFPQ
jgi:hypothetical protein